MPYTNFEVVTNEFEVKAQDHVYSPRLIKFTSIWVLLMFYNDAQFLYAGHMSLCCKSSSFNRLVKGLRKSLQQQPL